MERFYSTLTLKAVDEDQRTIEGIATTPATDRVGDIVEPTGAVFKLPLPLLWQHDSRKPIGYVTEVKVTAEGIYIKAKIERTDEPGALRDRLEEAWQSIKLKLVRGLSIGFNSIEHSRIENTYSYRYLKWEWLELSCVTIAANIEATITAIKTADQALLAASGQLPRRVVRLITPGAAGSTIHAKENAMNLAEQIAALEASRQAKSARMEEIQTKASGEGRTKDPAEKEEFDTLRDEIKSIDAELVDLRDLEANKAKTAKPVGTVKTGVDGSDARTPGNHLVVKTPQKLEPGIAFARLAKVKGIAFLNRENEKVVAERMYGADSDIAAIVTAQMEKGTVVPGSNANGNWAAALTGAQTSVFADFAAFLRPATILGKFGQGNIPTLRSVPFRERLLSQVGGGAGYWVGEGKPTPLTAFDFTGTTLEPLKVGNIAVLTKENIKSSSPNSEMIVRDALRDALVATQDLSFIDPTNAGSANVKPASITNGAATVASTGTDADAIRMDIRALFQKFIDANNPPENGVFIMSTTNALALSIMTNALGQREFPQMTMMGGILEGLPVIASSHAGNIVVLVNASDIYQADEGEIDVEMSTEASLEMKDSALTQDGSTGTGVAMVSLFQNGLVALKAEKTISWKRRRTSGVAYLTGVQWGGAVPVS